VLRHCRVTDDGHLGRVSVASAPVSPVQLRHLQLPQLVIDERQQFLHSLRVALLYLRHDAGDIGHAGQHSYRLAEMSESKLGRAPRLASTGS